MCFRLGWCCSTPSPRCPAATARPSNPTSSHTFYPSHRSGTYPQLEDISLLLNTRPARDIWILNKSFALFPLEIYRHTYRYRKLQISSLWFTFNCNLKWKQMSWYGHVQHYVNSVWTLHKLPYLLSILKHHHQYPGYGSMPLLSEVLTFTQWRRDRQHEKGIRVPVSSLTIQLLGLTRITRPNLLIDAFISNKRSSSTKRSKQPKIPKSKGPKDFIGLIIF